MFRHLTKAGRITALLTASALLVAAGNFGASIGPANAATKPTSNRVDVYKLANGTFKVALDLKDVYAGKAIVLNAITKVKAKRVTTRLGGAKLKAKGVASLAVAKKISIGSTLVVLNGKRVLFSGTVSKFIILKSPTPKPTATTTPSPSATPSVAPSASPSASPSAEPIPSGGGGGGGGSSVQSPNQPPALGPDALAQAQSGIAAPSLYTAIAADPERDAIAYTLSSQRGFSINAQTGVVSMDNTVVPSTYALTITATSTGGSDTQLLSVTVSASNLPLAILSASGATTRTGDGFTSEITNFDAAFDWNVSVTPSGSVSIVELGGAQVLVVTGLAPSTEATVTITSSRAGYAPVAASINSSSLGASLTPEFGTVIRTADGFVVAVENYEPAFVWNFTATAGNAAYGAGVLTVAGLTPSESATVSVTTTRSGYVTGQASISGEALNAGVTPVFDVQTPTADGFVVQISNYDMSFTWTATSDLGSVSIDSTGLVEVTYVTPDTEATVTVVASRDGYTSEQASVAGTSLREALTPDSGAATRTLDGFTSSIQNYDASYTWSVYVNEGNASISGTGLLTITGLAAGVTITAEVTSTRAGYAQGLTQVSGSSLSAALQADFGTIIKTVDGFTAQIVNFDESFNWSATATSGVSASISGTGILTVTGLDPNTDATVAVDSSRAGYVDGTSSITGASLQASRNPILDTPVRTVHGFEVRIQNYNANFTWTATSSAGSAQITEVGADTVVVVSGLSPGESATVTVSTDRDGYASGSSDESAAALEAALTPTFGSYSENGQAHGMDIQIANYSSDFTWSVTSDIGTASISNSGLITLSNIYYELTTFSVTTSRVGYATGQNGNTFFRINLSQA